MNAGATGFIHVAHDMLGSGDPSIAIPQAVNMALNALKSSSAAGLTRFVYTSSSFAVTQPRPNISFSVSEDTFNEAAIQAVKEKGEAAGGATVYSASKVEVEHAMKKWKDENQTNIVINCVNPNANLGPVLAPKHQGYPTTAGWTKNIWDGNYAALKRAPEHYINVVDDAKLHVIALAHPNLSGKRILAMAAPAPISEIVKILRKAYPERKLEDFEDNGMDLCENKEKTSVEALLREVYGHGYTSLEDSITANARELV